MSVGRILAAACAELAMGGCAAVGGRDRIVEAPAACGDIAAQIYFEPNSAELTTEAATLIARAATQAQGCRVDQIRVVGLADAAGAPAANLELSKRRAAAVTAALAANGLPAAEFVLEAVGQDGAVTPEGTAPLRRRADILIAAKPKK
jgi:peptidoglycan-associated lipoprotein